MRWWTRNRSKDVNDVVHQVTTQAATVRDGSDTLRKRAERLEQAANRLIAANEGALHAAYDDDDVDPR